MKITDLSLIAALLLPSAALAQGDLTPPSGTPTAGMKTLTQVEPRTPISGATTISQRGSYYLTGNISVAGGTAITITGNGVNLDLNGFTIECSASPTGSAIAVNASNITILNGSIVGPGFVNGIYASNTAYTNLTAKNINVVSCQEKGIVFLGTYNTVVDSCSVQGISSTNLVSSRGIQAKIVKGSTASDCSFAAIVGDVITGCFASVNTSGPASSVAINGDVVTDCTADISSSSASSHAIVAETVTNCKGTATIGGGISSLTANNCTGTSTSSEGIFAFTVSNCYATSNSGIPINAGIGNVSFSHAVRNSSGVGIQAGNAIGCTIQGTGVTVTATNKSLGTP